jgi:methyltransferase (TIGR00027 family)
VCVRQVASHRAAESLRPASYFYGKDVLAQYLAGDDVLAHQRQEASVYASAADTLNVVTMRTLAIDDRLLAAPHLRQVVVVGAGLDSRPYRLPLPHAAWFEADMPAVIQRKEAILAALDPALTRLSVRSLARVTFNAKFDMSELFISLEEKGFDRSEPTLFLLEGLVMYLTVADVQKIFQALPATEGSRAIVSVISANRQILTNPVFVFFISWLLPGFTSHKVAQLWLNDMDLLLQSSAFAPWVVDRNVNIGAEQLAERRLHLSRFADGIYLPNMKTTPENLLDLSVASS